MEIVTSIDVDAPTERVWEVLRDFAAYPEWNPTVVRIEGEPRVGATVKFRIRMGKRAVPLDAEVVQADESGLAWVGPARSLLRPAASGHHYFRIEPRTDGTCRFVHGERFSGPGFRLLWRRLEPQLRRGYAKYNEALKRRAERSPA